MNQSVTEIVFDSRNIIPDSLFVAVRGTQTDGHQYIMQAIEKGAKVIVAETFEEINITGIVFLRVKDSHDALALMAANFYDHPSEKLKLIGVTGTNGKTTFVSMYAALINRLGFKCGLLSTIENKIGEEILPSTHTTPDPLSINLLLHQMIEKGCTHCTMEISSHAIVQKRIASLHFTGAVFTNITHDHLDYHLTFRNYLDAKKAFFDQLQETAFALVNADDKHSAFMVQNTKAMKKTYGIRNLSDFKGRIIENDFNGLHLLIDGHDFHSDKIGSFNAQNIMAVYGAAVLSGIEKEKVLQILSVPTRVEGRFELISKSKKYLAILDYAHTPDALMNVIRTINEIKKGEVNLITVFGCGGNRDKTKRPEMGKIASEMSDQIIITSDNPRNEDPHQIIREIEEGVSENRKDRMLVIAEREMAIKTACKIAKEGDIVLVAGKGHEKYQEVSGVKYPFDDKEIVLKYLKS